MMRFLQDIWKCSPGSMLLIMVVVSVSMMFVQVFTHNNDLHRAAATGGLPLLQHPRFFKQQQWRRAQQQQERREQQSLGSEEQQQEQQQQSQQEAPVVVSEVSEADEAARLESVVPEYHMVFSSSCHDQQNWESMVFFYHAWKVNQPGTVTRIVSGCTAEQQTQQQQQQFFDQYIRPLSPTKFKIHFTPDYSNVQKAHGYSYKYMNKPYGLRHWMEHGPLQMMQQQSNQQQHDNHIVLLLDPDMILLRPLTHEFEPDHLFAAGHNDKHNNNNIVRVRPGHPVAQQDGYLDNEWMDLDIAHVFRLDNTTTTLPPRVDGPRYWNTGPPYLATVRDMYRIAVQWCHYAPRVVQIYPELFAEMYGFIYATVHLQLPFTLIKSIVVSTTESRSREGWPWIDALQDNVVCQWTLPEHNTNNMIKLPNVLHYCKRYLYGPMFFSKYRVKKNIMDCNKPLLQEPPVPFVGHYNYSMFPPRADAPEKYHPKPFTISSNRTAKREAFMLCALTRAINEALVDHKQRACITTSAPPNLNKTYTVYNDPTNY